MRLIAELLSLICEPPRWYGSRCKDSMALRWTSWIFLLIASGLTVSIWLVKDTWSDIIQPSSKMNTQAMSWIEFEKKYRWIGTSSLIFHIPLTNPLSGIPLFYLELAVGQRMRKAAISCWNLVSPFAAGIGIASAAVSFIIGLYYNTMVAWTLIYLWDSSNSSNSTNLPYSRCHKLDQASSSGQTLATFTSTNKHTGISKQANGFIQATAGIQPTNSSNNECQVSLSLDAKS